MSNGGEQISQIYVAKTQHKTTDSSGDINQIVVGDDEQSNIQSSLLNKKI